jgi:LEA14-like dessication related protein
MKTINLIAFASIIIFFSSCTAFKPIEVEKVHNFSIESIDKEAIEVSFEVQINNPNSFNFKVTDLDLDVSFNNKKLGEVRKLDNVAIPKKSNESHKFVAKVEFSEVGASLIPLAGSLLNKKAEFEFKGYVKARWFFLVKKLPIDEKKAIKIPEKLFKF